MLQLRPSCECRDTLAQNLNGLSPRAARIAWASGLPGRDEPVHQRAAGSAQDSCLIRALGRNTRIADLG
jgi:hypothetical protein